MHRSGPEFAFSFVFEAAAWHFSDDAWSEPASGPSRTAWGWITYRSLLLLTARMRRGASTRSARLTEVEKPAELRRRGGVWLACGDQELHVGVARAFAPAKKAHPALRVASGAINGLADRLGNGGFEIHCAVLENASMGPTSLDGSVARTWLVWAASTRCQRDPSIPLRLIPSRISAATSCAIRCSVSMTRSIPSRRGWRLRNVGRGQSAAPSQANGPAHERRCEPRPCRAMLGGRPREPTRLRPRP